MIGNTDQIIVPDLVHCQGAHSRQPHNGGGEVPKHLRRKCHVEVGLKLRLPS